ncbi:MAG TPA: hypothetical protein PKA50_08010, partial [Gemmatimonadales bacterium]|nr:hypothetical protein [Gemmatimonadales bacterium]
MSIAVAPFTGTAAEWDGFVSAQEGWTHFHRYGWREVFAGVFGHECFYLEARDADGVLAGVLPLVRVKSVPFGHYLVSLPFVNYGGPLGTAAAIRALVAWAVERAAADGVKLLELRSRQALPVELPVSHRKITVVLDLPADPDKLMKGFEAKLRSQVRRPAKEGITVRFGPDQVGP